MQKSRCLKIHAFRQQKNHDNTTTWSHSSGVIPYWKGDSGPPLLKEYYEIINEAHRLSGFFPTDAIFFYRNAFIRDVTHWCSKNLKCLKTVKKNPFAYTFVHEKVTEKTWIQVKTWRVTSLKWHIFNIELKICSCCYDNDWIWICERNPLFFFLSQVPSVPITRCCAPIARHRGLAGALIWCIPNKLISSTPFSIHIRKAND